MTEDARGTPGGTRGTGTKVRRTTRAARRGTGEARGTEPDAPGTRPVTGDTTWHRPRERTATAGKRGAPTAPLPLPPEVAEMLDAGALSALSHSGGKDGHAMTILLRRVVPPGQLVVHAPLGRVEWPGTLAHVRAATRGLALILARARTDLLAMVRRRGRFPTPAIRQCTSDLKRGPIERQVRRIPEGPPPPRGPGGQPHRPEGGRERVPREAPRPLGLGPQQQSRPPVARLAADPRHERDASLRHHRRGRRATPLGLLARAEPVLVLARTSWPRAGTCGSRRNSGPAWPRSTWPWRTRSGAR